MSGIPPSGRRLFLLLALGLVGAPVAHAQLDAARLFRSGAVLQRGQTVPVWGRGGTADSLVVVTLDTLSVATRAEADGRWRVELPPRDAGGPFALTIASGADTLAYSDVYVGDVWLAAGQSNMAWTVAQSTNAAAVIAASNDPLLRQFKVTPALAEVPQDTLPAGSAWTSATPATAGAFSAVGYFFARDLRQHHDVAIAIVNASYDGSRIETWMSEEMLGFDAAHVVLGNGEPYQQAALAYHQMIHPLVPFPVVGFLWYQGEANGNSTADAIGYGESRPKTSNSTSSGRQQNRRVEIYIRANNA